MASMQEILTALKAVAEPTRLRILALLRRGELTVTELTQILRQSQPRVSRHLKLMCDAAVLDRFREGTWVFYRLGEAADVAELSGAIVRLLPEDDAEHARDLERLAAVKRTRADVAAAYFRENAANWDRIRSLHVPEGEVEARLVKALEGVRINSLLDVGTGTGRMLSLMAGKIRKGIGVDLSSEMLSLARANLEREKLDHCQVRRANMYDLPFDNGSQDAVIFHQVLHYADDPQTALSEAGRLLALQGHLLIVDFAPHDREELRDEQAHRRLGFTDAEVTGWAEFAGLSTVNIEHLTGGELTVTLWHFTKDEHS